MTLRDEDRALIARSAAALRRNGWPAGRALRLVAENVGGAATGARAELLRIADALERGEKESAGSDPLLRLLAQGDAAGADALVEAARSFEVRREARLVARAGIAYPLVIISFAAVLFFLAPHLAAALDVFFRDFGWALPLPTRFVLAVLRMGTAFGIACVVTAGASLALLGPLSRRVPGVRGLEAAALLRRYSAAIGAAVPRPAALALVDPKAHGLFGARALRLDRLETALGVRWARAGDERLAAEALAFELEVSARRAAGAARRWMPIVAFFTAAGVVGLAVLALYLPLLTITSSLH